MTFNEQLSFFPGQRTWGAVGDKGTYLILDDRDDFTASFQTFKSRRTIHLIDFKHPVASFDDAKAICEAHNV